MRGRTDELNSSSTSEISPDLAEKLISLAQKYESADFLRNDPSQFMHRYSEAREAETVAFIAGNLAFGRREQILSHVEAILCAAGDSPSGWILSKSYENFFPDNGNSFYRMYTNHDMRVFFSSLRSILEEGGTIGEFFRRKWEGVSSQNGRGDDAARAVGAERGIFLHQVIADSFPRECALLPHSKDSAAKKVNMLLRWLVRTDSPVDLGLWTWFDRRGLLMPLDTHVMRQSNELGLIHSRSANLSTAVALTKKAAGIFPDDPLRADFALFGLGVSAG